MIHVIATISLQSGQREAFLAAFKKLVPLVKAEAGCIEYGPAVDVPSGIGAQAELRPDSVTVIEKWESLDHLKAHLAAPHMEAYRDEVKDMVAGMTLHILEPA